MKFIWVDYDGVVWIFKLVDVVLWSVDLELMLEMISFKYWLESMNWLESAVESLGAIGFIPYRLKIWAKEELASIEDDIPLVEELTEAAWVIGSARFSVFELTILFAENRVSRVKSASEDP